jgi:cytochrome c oxidase subunit 2
MLFQVEVVSQEDYDAYIASQRAAGFVGRIDSSYNANTNLPGTGAREIEHSTGEED